jgi:hypothetical protein
MEPLTRFHLERKLLQSSVNGRRHAQMVLLLFRFSIGVQTVSVRNLVGPSPLPDLF